MPGFTRRRAVAILLGAGAALLAGEIVARILVPAYAQRRSEYVLAERGASWVYEPGSAVTFAWDGDPFDVLPADARVTTRINGLGLRGPVPRPGAPCVVLLGDSFVFGEGVADADTLPRLLERRLAALRKSAPAVVNAGVSAHGTPEEAARVPDLLQRFAPRALVLVHVPNDSVPWNHAAGRPRDLLHGQAAGGVRLLALARSSMGAGELEAWYLSFYEGPHRESWARSRAALASVARACRERGVRLGVACFPFLHRLDDSPLTAITDHVRAACRELEVPFHDLLPAFAGRDVRTLWVHPTDHHPNARAFALAAEHLAPFVDSLLW